MTLQKKDFVEMNFTAKIKDGPIFDSNIAEDLKLAGIETKSPPKPFVFSLGEGMFLKSVEEFLIGKDPGKYSIDLEAENAFGNREPRLVQVMPIKIFHEHKINPIPGVSLNFDGRVAKILSVNGGRVTVDFNHPLAGKAVVYDVNILRKVEDLNEKVSAFSNFLFGKDVVFEIKENKIIMELEKNFANFAKVFEEKFKELFGLGLEVKETTLEAEKQLPKEIDDLSKESKIQ